MKNHVVRLFMFYGKNKQLCRGHRLVSVCRQTHSHTRPPRLTHFTATIIFFSFFYMSFYNLIILSSKYTYSLHISESLPHKTNVDLLKCTLFCLPSAFSQL